MNTKEELLTFMHKHHACEESHEWVNDAEGTFADIVNACPNVDWLCFLLAHMRPRAAADFAIRCADRIKPTDRKEWGISECSKETAFASANRSHGLANDDCPPAITTSDAAYWAWHAAADRDAEQALQLKDLREAILAL